VKPATAVPVFSSENLAQRTIERRAVEAVIWGTPGVNFDRMYQAMVHDAKAGEGSNKIVYWSRLFNWKNQTLTPNPDSIYFMPFFNTKDVGPVVLEVPPADGGSITGSVDDCWQTAIEDVGPAGLDKGKGGKYLILPPGYKDKPPAGYIPLQAYNYEGFALLRSILKSSSEADVAKAVAYGKQVKLYPLSQAAHPPATQFVDAIDVVYDATLPWDMRYFESLNRIIQTEPWLTRDKAMIDQLKSIGIEKGKPFNPDAKTQDTLKSAVGEAHAWLANKYENSYFPPAYYEGGHWYVPASSELIEGLSNFYADPDKYPVDDRGITYSFAFFSPKHLGAGQFYLMTFRDKDNHGLEGGCIYSSTSPPTHPSRSTGQPPSTTAILTPLSATCNGPVAPHRPRDCKRTPTVQWAFTSVPTRRRARSRTGFPPAPMEDSRSSSASTGHKSPLRQDLEAAGHREVELKPNSSLGLRTTMVCWPTGS
jgi:hypothetical protein